MIGLDDIKPDALEAAVAVLNDLKHRGHSEWHVGRSGDGWIVDGNDHYEHLTPFEAVAVALLYAAQAGGVDIFPNLEALREEG